MKQAQQLSPADAYALTAADMARYIHAVGYYKLSEGIRPANFSTVMVTERLAMVELCGVTWQIVNNGGELKVKRVNLDQFSREIPLETQEGTLNYATVGRMLASALTGEAIDYDFRVTEEEAAILAEA